MFFVLSKLLDVFLSPYTWGLVLLGAAVPWRAPDGARWKRRRGFAIAGFAILLGCSLEPVSNALLYRLERSTPTTYRPDVTYDVVVLLGGVGDERVVAEMKQPAFNDNVERVIATHRLLADAHARYAIVSGAAESPELAPYGEARVLAQQIADWGVDPERVILEEKARNTRENAVYSERIIRERGFQKVLIVTSAFHMRRSVECFRAVGLEVDTLAVDYRAFAKGRMAYLPREPFLSETVRTVREMAGLYIYRAQGYAKP